MNFLLKIAADLRRMKSHAVADGGMLGKMLCKVWRRNGRVCLTDLFPDPLIENGKKRRRQRDENSYVIMRARPRRA